MTSTTPAGDGEHPPPEKIKSARGIDPQALLKTEIWSRYLEPLLSAGQVRIVADELAEAVVARAGIGKQLRRASLSAEGVALVIGAMDGMDVLAIRFAGGRTPMSSEYICMIGERQALTRVAQAIAVTAILHPHRSRGATDWRAS